MNIVEHNDSLVTKQVSEVERYLLRIIQRYFDIQYVETQNSIEAIIVESLTRMKRDILHEKAFVFDVNGRAGHLTLNASSFGAESAFSKNTAFNKDFAPNGQSVPDTICEGNDSRLSDKRNPKSHNHSRYDNFIDKDGIPIVDSNGAFLRRISSGSTLNDLLEHARLTGGEANHAHLNYDSVLKRLRYSGSKTEIDLAKIAVVKKSLTGKLDEAKGLYESLPKIVDNELSVLEIAKEKAKEYLEYANSLSKTPPAWFDDAIKYTDNEVSKIEKYCNDKIDSAVTQEELTDFTENTAKKYIHIYSSGENILLDKCFMTVKGSTFISEFSHIFTLPTTNEKILRVDSFVKYNIGSDSDDSIVPIHIPMPIIQTNSDGSLAHIYCKWNDNSLQIICKTIISLPFVPEESQNFNGLIIQVSEELATLYKIKDLFKNGPTRLCVIDSQDKIDFILPMLEPDTLYSINGYGYFGFDESSPSSSWWHIGGSGEKISFENWDTSDSEYGLCDGTRYLFLSSSTGKIVTRKISPDLKTKYIYEYAPKRLSDYYDSPSIFYNIYTGEGD